MKRSIIAVFCLLGALVVNSQKIINTKYGPFQAGWYAGINGGGSLFMGEGNNFFLPEVAFVSPAKNVGNLIRAELGYNFTPIIGLRGMLGSYNFTWNTVPTSMPTVYFSSENLTMDVIINLSNWRKGFNPRRKVDFSVFAGLGLAYLNENKLLVPLAGIFRGGLQADYHLNSQFALNLIAEGNIATDNFNDLSYGSIPVDIFPALTLGLTYQLPQKTTRKP